MPPQTLQTQLSVQQSESPLQLPFVGWQLVIGLHVLLLSQVSVERQQGVPSEQLLPSFAHEPPSAAPGWQVSELESQFRPSQQPDPSPQYTFSWLQAPPSADVVEIVVQTPLLGSQLRPSVQHWPRLQS